MTIGNVVTITSVLLGAAVGAVAGMTIQRLIRRRRLRKRGFTAEDLSSQETFYKRLAELTLQKLPQRISLEEILVHSWSKKAVYARSRDALERLGFERNAIFVASPQKWVAEIWLSTHDGLFAAILDSPPYGIHTEVIVEYRDGSTVSFEDTDECGRQHLENHSWIHCGSIGADQLLQRALRDRRSDHVGKMQVSDCLRAYERANNETLAWRQKVGFSPAEIKHAYDRARSRQTFLAKLW